MLSAITFFLFFVLFCCIRTEECFFSSIGFKCQISIVMPVYENDRVSLAKLLRSMRNLCNGCTDVTIVVITDDKSKQSIYHI